MKIGLINGETTYWLAGEPGVAESVHSSVRDFALSGDRQLEIATFVKGLITKQFDRDNQSNEVSFSTTRTFADSNAAWAFQLDYLDNIPLTGSLIFQVVTGGATITRYMGDCVMQRPEMDPVGVSLSLDYVVSGGNISEERGHYLTLSGGSYLTDTAGLYLTGT